MKKRILSILLLCCMVLTLLPTTVSAADGPMNTIPKYDVSIDVYNRTSDISIKDSRSYYIYSSVPDKLRDTWAWDKKIFIKGDKTAPHVFIDGVNIEMSPSSKGPAIELNKKASAYIYFIGKNSSLQGADGRAAIQKNRSEGQLYVLARTGTTVTCKGGDKAAGIGGSYATRNISNGYYNGDMYGHGVNMHFGSRSNPDYWGGTIAAIGGRTHTIEVIFMKANGNPQTGVFVDVATGSYYEDAVDWAVENGITKGTDDTHFSPDGICTRAQAVTFLWRAAGSPEPETRAMPFNDVPVGSYYYDAVLWAVENGITKGTSDTTFSPNMTCTRAQIVAFLWRSEKSPAAGTANPFADVKSTAYYADAVLWAVKENITKGTTSTTFSPNADCTRAQIVTFLWRCKK